MNNENLFILSDKNLENIAGGKMNKKFLVSSLAGLTFLTGAINLKPLNIQAIGNSKDYQIEKNDQQTTYKNHNDFFESLKDGFKTDHLIAVKTSEDDINILSDFLLDKKITFQLDPTLSDGFKNKDEAVNFLKDELKDNNSYNFTIKLKQSNTSIGQISFKYIEGGNILTPSFWITSDYQNNGYTSEIALPLTEKIFKNCSDIKTLYISCDYENTSSYKICEKICNFINKNQEYKYTKDSGYTTAEIDGKSLKFHYWEFKLSKTKNLDRQTAEKQIIIDFLKLYFKCIVDKDKVLEADKIFNDIFLDKIGFKVYSEAQKSFEDVIGQEKIEEAKSAFNDTIGVKKLQEANKAYDNIINKPKSQSVHDKAQEELNKVLDQEPKKLAYALNVFWNIIGEDTRNNAQREFNNILGPKILSEASNAYEKFLKENPGKKAQAQTVFDEVIPKDIRDKAYDAFYKVLNPKMELATKAYNDIMGAQQISEAYKAYHNSVENQKSSNIAEAKNVFNEVIGAELLSKAYQSYLEIINSKLDDAIISFTDVIYKNATENKILTFLNSYIYDSLDKLNKQQI